MADTREVPPGRDELVEGPERGETGLWKELEEDQGAGVEDESRTSEMKLQVGSQIMGPCGACLKFGQRGSLMSFDHETDMPWSFSKDHLAARGELIVGGRCGSRETR